MTSGSVSGRIASAAAFLFDLDGTLVDTEPLHHRSTNEVLAPFGASLPWAEYARCIGMSEHAFWDLLRNRFTLPESTEVLASRRTERLLASVIRGPVRPLPGVVATLAALERRGVPRAVASASPRRQIAATLATAGLAGFVQAFRSGHDDVPRSKPHPDVYLAAAAALGVAAAECIAVEDSVSGATAARAAGCTVVVVAAAPGAELVRQADLVLGTMEALALRVG